MNDTPRRSQADALTQVPLGVKVNPGGGGIVLVFLVLPHTALIDSTWMPSFALVFWKSTPQAQFAGPQAMFPGVNASRSVPDPLPPGSQNPKRN